MHGRALGAAVQEPLPQQLLHEGDAWEVVEVATQQPRSHA